MYTFRAQNSCIFPLWVDECAVYLVWYDLWLTRVVQCREKLLYPKDCRLTIIAAVSHVASGCIEDLHIRAVPQR